MTTLKTTQLRKLTLQQLETQYDQLNAARFMMERNFLGSAQTVRDLLEACMAVEEEIENRK
jgi:hypothetical protein